jgi:hypothetical protein
MCESKGSFVSQGDGLIEDNELRVGGEAFFVTLILSGTS